MVLSGAFVPDSLLAVVFLNHYYINIRSSVLQLPLFLLL